jgi:MFS family permease
MIVENCLLLEYSLKEDREKNIGYFRAAAGIGTAFTPLLISFCSAYIGDWGSFFIIGVALLLITPYVNYKLLAYR